MAVPLAHIIFLLDDSSSMSSHTQRTIQAFNTYVETLKKVKGAQIVMTLIKYGSVQDVIYKAIPIQDVPKLDYNPQNGFDTIYDSVAFAIRLAEAEKTPQKVVICVQCDGGDTSSKTAPSAVKAMVEEKLKKGWQFNFMGAGRLMSAEEKTAYSRYTYADAEGYWKVSAPGGSMSMLDVVRSIGFPEDCIIRYSAENADKTLKSFAASATNAASFTSGRKADAAFTPEQKKEIG